LAVNFEGVCIAKYAYTPAKLKLSSSNTLIIIHQVTTKKITTIEEVLINIDFDNFTSLFTPPFLF